MRKSLYTEGRGATARTLGKGMSSSLSFLAMRVVFWPFTAWVEEVGAFFAAGGEVCTGGGAASARAKGAHTKAQMRVSVFQERK